MKTLEKFTEAISNVVMIANDISNEVYGEMHKQAPLIVHQRMCGELVRVAKENLGGEKTDEFKRIMSAIDLLEELYPELKRKSA